MDQSRKDGQLNVRVTAIACVVSAFSVALDLWANRDSFDSDGISYLDLADAWRRGDWHAALVGHWSPLYSWLIAGVLSVFQPSPQWEFTAVHILNFVLFLVALASFRIFMREFLRFRNNSTATLPDWSWLVLDYSLFTWSTIRLIPPHLAVPDLIVCAAVYLNFAILFRVRDGMVIWTQAIVLGVLLAFGYLAKAVMFPMAFVFIATALFLAGRSSKRRLMVFVSLAVFICLSLPYAVALSQANDRWMFGDAGGLNYAWYVNNVKHWNHWQGENGGKPTHPTRKINDDPPMYEFETPFKVTYPPWYDPACWYDGVKLRIDLRKQATVIAKNVKALFLFLANSPGPALPNQLTFYSLDSGDKTVGCLLTLCGAMGLANFRAAGRSGRAIWFVYIPLAAVLGAYAMLFFEGRYIAPYVTVLWLALFRSVAIPCPDESKKFFAAILAMAALITFITTIIGTARVAIDSAHYFASGKVEAPLFQSGYTNWKVAEYLKDAGLRPGDPVGAVGWAYSWYWARMARLRIVAEVPEEGATEFWPGDDAKRNAVMRLFRDVGAKAVIAKAGYLNNHQQHFWDLHGLPGQVAPLPISRAEPTTADGSAVNWRHIGNTDYYVYLVEPRQE